MTAQKHNIIFAGAGPGAVDLITLRARNALAEADLVIHAGSLVNPEILDFTEPGCTLLDSAAMDLDEVIDAMVAAVNQGKRVVRLHTGDPAMYGAIAEQMNRLDELGIEYEVIPGVSSAFASAAALKAELTMPSISQTVILTRRAGRTPVPPGQDIKDLATHGATMCIFLSVSDMPGLVQELIDAGYTENTAVGVVYRASWDDQKVVRGALGDIAEKVKEAGISRQAMIVVGDVLKKSGELSKLYDRAFAHGYRDAKSPTNALFNGKVAIYAITQTGVKLAAKLTKLLPNSHVFIPERFAEDIDSSGMSPFAAGDMTNSVATNWNNYAGLVFIMATGIVVRKIAPLLKGKIQDPAVVVCDEKGRNAISLLSGHIGGANRLATQVADLIGGMPVITTATDVQGVMAFDELASRNGWEVANPKRIKDLNSLLLEGKRIGVGIPNETFDATYGKTKNVVRKDEVDVTEVSGLVLLDPMDDELNDTIPTLILRSGQGD